MANTKTRRARAQRQNMPDAEQHLWKALRQQQMHGFRFRRQYPLGDYIADFVCLRARLVIECDGGQHAGSAHDARRDTWLRRQDFTVIRFWNHEVLQETEAVLEKISEWLAGSDLRKGTPTPTLPREGGGSKSAQQKQGQGA